MKNKIKYQYPWRSNNTFEVLIDGLEYFPSMLASIEEAKSNILLETYLFESGTIADKFITALCAAKKRGVDIFILLDEYGTKNLVEKDKNKLSVENIELCYYNPVRFFHLGKSLKRNHRKLLSIDNHIAFIGGAGITDNFSPQLTKNYWHDVMLKIKGDIIYDLNHSFYNIWDEKDTTQIKKLKNSKELQEHNKARVLLSKGTEKNEIVRAIINHIRSSKKQVWLTSPYFISSSKIRRALRKAAKKGLDVRLIFPGPHSDHKWITYGIHRYYQRLLKAKIKVYEFQPRFSHSKIILCDDWYTVGSSNLDRWNQFLNLDANIEVYDQSSRQQIIALFEDDFSNSKLILLKQWSNRNVLQHYKEWLSGIIIKGLSIISGKFKR